MEGAEEQWANECVYNILTHSRDIEGYGFPWPVCSEGEINDEPIEGGMEEKVVEQESTEEEISGEDKSSEDEKENKTRFTFIAFVCITIFLVFTRRS
jgi:hypothetical protein